LANPLVPIWEKGQVVVINNRLTEANNTKAVKPKIKKMGKTKTLTKEKMGKITLFGLVFRL